jgi:DGQHR domain-containing protein
LLKSILLIEKLIEETGQMEDKQLRIPVIQTEIARKKIPMAVGVITAGSLADGYVIPRRDTRRKTGYQRDVSEARVSRLMKELQAKRVDLPTAVLLNLRQFDETTQLELTPSGAHLCLRDSPLYVVDGQHRIEALRRLVEGDSDRWSSYHIPFVCMLGASEQDEMEQFYVVNSTAKSVRTDLALDILKQRAELDPEVLKSLEEQGSAWKVHGQVLTEDLAKTPIWNQRIRFPGDAKGQTTIGSAAMVGSLKSLLTTPFFGMVGKVDQVKILDAYWQGLRQILPEAFDDPATFTLQKSTGVMAMHSLLVSAIEYLRSTGVSLTEPNSYRNALENALNTLEGDTSLGDVARGSDFWRAGAQGAAGSFSSNAGRRVLLAKLKGLLPRVEVE